MRFSAEALASIPPSDLIVAVRPCRVTHDFLELLVDAAEHMRLLHDGQLLSEQAMRTFVAERAELAAAETSYDQLGVELDALATTQLQYDMGDALIARLARHSGLQIAKNLEITLGVVYGEMLSRVLLSVATPS